MSELKWIRIQDFRLIPRKLLAQVNDSDVLLDRLEIFGPQLAKDPLIILYALSDEHNQVRGFLWAHISIIENHVFVDAYSVDPDYQDRQGTLLKKALDILSEITQGSQLSGKVYCATTRPKAFEKVGFTRRTIDGKELINLEADLWAKKAAADQT